MSAASPVASLRKHDLVLAFAAVLVVVAVNTATGFTSLGSTEDNDSLLRLVEVRDMLSGQNWFDLHQYRMGPEGGFVMHWSRLVDAPLAGPDVRPHRVLHPTGRAPFRRRQRRPARPDHVCDGTAFPRHLRSRRARPSQYSTDADHGQRVLPARRPPTGSGSRAGRDMRGADAGDRHGNRVLC